MPKKFNSPLHEALKCGAHTIFSPAPSLNVKPDIQYVAILNDILFALEVVLAGFFYFLLGVETYEIVTP